MDRTGIIVVALCIALLAVWFVEQEKYGSRLAQSQATTNALVTGQTQFPGSNAAPATTMVPAVSLAAPENVPTNGPEQTIVLTNKVARFIFTSRGGGLKSVDLLDYPETVSPRWKSEVATNAVATLNTRAPVPMMTILGGGTDLIGNGRFALSRIGNTVRAEKTLRDGLNIVKEFHIGSNYLVNVTARLENTSDKPLPLPAQELVVGTATPMDPDDLSFSYYGGAMWYNGASEQSFNLSYFNTNTTVLLVFPRTPKSEYREGSNNVVWAAAYNQFFTMLAMPKTPAAQIVANPVDLEPFPNIELPPGSPLLKGIQTELVYPAQTLGTNEMIERQVVLYTGPKEYRTLAHIAEQFHNHADLAMNFGTGYMSFWGVGTFFAKLLLSGMNWLHDVFRVGYGWTIVLITILLRAAFWPLTAASVRSMKKMQALAPEVKALKEKYKDDQQKFTQKQMELWRKHKVNPMSGCFPMLIQMPVFFGFLSMLRSSIELRGAHFLWVTDLTKPDTIFVIPGLNFPFNLLPLLMVGVMVWQAHLQPPSPGMDPSQQKIMRYIPLIFLVFLYNYSSGMALYMTVSTLLGVLQTKLTRNLKDPAAPALTPAPKRKK